MASKRLSLFRFYINDPDPESVMFGCVAETEYEAEALARAAGYKDVTLFDQRLLDAEETSEAAQKRIDEHPLLGPEWAPLVEVVSVITSELTTRRFWVLDTYGMEYQLDPYRSPFVQAILEADGSLHVEIAGRNVELPERQVEQFGLLEMLGWMPPADGDVIDAVAAGRLPNPHRVFDAGWNARAVAEAFLEALTCVYGITNKDFFNFGENAMVTVLRLGLLKQSGDGPIFSLPDESDQLDNAVAQDESLDETPEVVASAELQVCQYSNELPSVEPTVIDHIVSAFTREGNELPFVTASLGSELEIIDEANWGLRSSRVEPMSLYHFFMPPAEFVQGDWANRLQFGIAGHGMNSYAWSYVHVEDGIAFFAQSPRGLIYFNPVKTAEAWAILMDGARKLSSATKLRAENSPDHIFIVIWNSLRAEYGFSWQRRIDREATWVQNLHDEAMGDLANNPDEFFQAAVDAFLAGENHNEEEINEFFDSEDVMNFLLDADLVDTVGGLSSGATRESVEREKMFLSAQAKKTPGHSSLMMMWMPITCRLTSGNQMIRMSVHV